MSFTGLTLKATKTGINTATDIIEGTCEFLPNLGLPVPVGEMGEMCEFVTAPFRTALKLVENLIDFTTYMPESIKEYVDEGKKRVLETVDIFIARLETQLGMAGGYLPYLMGPLGDNATAEEKVDLAKNVFESLGLPVVELVN
mmetsp:Transcript_23787/g.54613  ORF Transcript_23787/g.54613 Transcript_23787/m.54613 type:complete len:143 (-) Transcript_23787:2196-2624(-)